MEHERPLYYVHEYRHTIDDKNRLTVPSAFEIPRGGLIYFEPRFLGVRCYDEGGFAKLAESLPARRFKHFKHHRIDSSGRISLNGYFFEGEEVLITGRGKYFFVHRDETLFESLKRRFKKKK